jgi:hypothetical protein
MESNQATNISDLLSRLAQLEGEVTSLSSQLESNKITINHLKQSLSERDLRINELEAKLVRTQNSLLKTASDKIHQCREQIRNGVDIKIVTPALGQIQKYIEATESLIAEVRDFIARKKISMNEGIIHSSSLVRQSPEQVRMILEKNIISPIKAIVEKHVRSLKIIYRVCHDWVERELITRYERIISALRDIPLNTRILLQMRVLEPALAQIENLSALVQGQNVKNAAAGRLKQSFAKIRQLANECLEFIEEQIKKSPFWDGKQRMRPAM